MHETTPPSGVGTDLSSSRVPLLPGPPGYQRIFAPLQIQLTRSRPHPASSIRTSPHGVGQDMAKPEGSKARAKQTRFAGHCHQPSPPSSGAVLLPHKLSECRMCSCALSLAWASCLSEVVRCRAGQQLQPPSCAGRSWLSCCWVPEKHPSAAQLLAAPGSVQGRSRQCQGTA